MLMVVGVKPVQQAFLFLKVRSFHVKTFTSHLELLGEKGLASTSMHTDPFTCKHLHHTAAPLTPESGPLRPSCHAVL